MLYPRQPADQRLAGDRAVSSVGGGDRGGRDHVHDRLRLGDAPAPRGARTRGSRRISRRRPSVRRSVTDATTAPRRRSRPARTIDPGRAGIGARRIRRGRARRRRGRRAGGRHDAHLVAPRPSMGELGLTGWFRHRLGERSIRADRSRSLTGERGGRLDRLDLWFLVVLVLATMTLRTFRLAEPYQMHFDEVYHARTATEFLQSWRYGLSHDIYEWTHPHLAKYAMALGMVLWGEDDVKATSDLGVPVGRRGRRAAADRPGRPRRARRRAAVRRDRHRDPGLRPPDAGARSRPSRRRASSALAIDASSLQLVVGYDDGRVATLDLAAIGPGDVAAGVAPRRPGRPSAGPVDLLYVTADGASVAVGQGDHLDVVDAATGTVVGRARTCRGWPASADGGSGSALVGDGRRRARPVRGRVGAGRAPGRERGGLRGAARRAPARRSSSGSPGDKDTRDKVEAAIADGRLAGHGGRGPAAHRGRDDAGVTFVDPATASTISTIVADRRRPRPRPTCRAGRPEAVRHVRRRRRRRPTTSSPSRATAPSAGRSTAGRTRCRASGWVVYDAASQMVHILGHAPTTAGTFEPPPAGRTRRGPSTSSSRTATPSSPTRASARRASCPSVVGRRRRTPTTRRPTASSSSSSTAPARWPSIDVGLARLRLAAPGRHRRRAHRGLHLPAAADPLPAPARRRSWPGSSCWSTGCSSSSRGSA